jgi:hypothetical protein
VLHAEGGTLRRLGLGQPASAAGSERITRVAPSIRLIGTCAVNTSIDSCYISAPAGSDLGVLKRALHDRRIRVVDPTDFAPGSSISAEVMRVLPSVDLVIGILTRERRSDWTLYELGLAAALARRVVVIAPVGELLPPQLDLSGIMVVRADPGTREAIEFVLDQLLAAPRRAARSQPVKANRDDFRFRADMYLSEANRLMTMGSGEEFETLLASALRESGVDALVREPSVDRGADIAVWSDALQAYVGNPLLIEVKMRLGSLDQLRDAGMRLAQQVLSTGGQWGLLIYGVGPPTHEVQNSVVFNVLAISVHDLFERMRSAPFASVVNEMRNRRAHGVPF